jgi:hypothetical protein
MPVFQLASSYRLQMPCQTIQDSLLREWRRKGDASLLQPAPHLRWKICDNAIDSPAKQLVCNVYPVHLFSFAQRGVHTLKDQLNTVHVFTTIPTA